MSTLPNPDWVSAWLIEEIAKLNIQAISQWNFREYWIKRMTTEVLGFAVLVRVVEL